MKRARLASAVPPMRINVVPIIDVSLVLVVILLVTAPVLAVSNMPITLPRAETLGVEDELRVSITIGKQGEIAVDEDDIPPARLRAAVAKRIADTRPDVLVAVRADASLPYAQVEAVLKEARLAGAKRIAIATRQGDQVLDGAPRPGQASEGGSKPTNRATDADGQPAPAVGGDSQ